jgi:hypothetical protein
MADTQEVTWPVGKIDYGTWAWLRREICGYMDYGFEYHTLEHVQKGKVLSIIQSGLRQYYFPPPLEGQSTPHTWSFLTPVRTINLKDGTNTFEMPASFSGVVGDLTYKTGTGRKVVPVVPELQLRQRASQDAKSGPPEYVAFRPVHVDPAGAMPVRTYYEALLYPTPDSTVDGLLLEYRSQVVPPLIDDDTDYAQDIFGGPNHTELILASCLAVAEQRYKGGPGTYSLKFLSDLKSALQVDLATLKPTEEAIWPSVTTEYGTLAWVRREVGGYLKFGYDHKAWNATQKGRVLSAIQSGLMQFYFPPPTEGTAVHQWSFLTPVRSITLAASDATYGLPADFSGIIGDLTWQTGEGTQVIPIVAESQVRQLQAADPQTGAPKYAAVRPVNNGLAVTHEIVLYPIPTSTEAGSLLEYRSQIVPPQVDDESDYALQLYGSQQHAEAILASCLAVAEQREKGGPGEYAIKYGQQLQVSIQNDLASLKPTEDAIWPIENDRTNLKVNKLYLKRLIGRQMKFGPHSAGWNHKQSSEVQIVLERGLRQFYDPVMVNATYTHEWSFMRPLWTFSTVADQYIYELPADFVMLYGPILFSPDSTTLMEQMEEVPLYKVRQWLQTETSGRPRLCALNSKSVPTLGGVQWELWMAPKPDQEYSLTLPYKSSPLALADDATLPHGGMEHHETLIESCLAAAEAFQEKKGPHYDRFMQLLATSVARDQKQSSPDMIGYNFDPSDRPQNYPWLLHHFGDTQTVTYNGSVIPVS